MRAQEQIGSRTVERDREHYFTKQHLIYVHLNLNTSSACDLSYSELELGKQGCVQTFLVGVA